MQPHTITSPPTPTKTILDTLTIEASVRVVGYAYLVDLGCNVKPRLHTVHKDRSCNCGDAHCPAINIVADWLYAGRLDRAPDPPVGYTAFVPKVCPVCGASVFADHTLSSRTRGLGWQCTVGYVSHYWQHRWELVKGWFFRDEILPGVNRADVQARAKLPLGYLPSANRSAVEPTHHLQPDATLLNESGIARGPL